MRESKWRELKRSPRQISGNAPMNGQMQVSQCRAIEKNKCKQIFGNAPMNGQIKVSQCRAIEKNKCKQIFRNAPMNGQIKVSLTERVKYVNASNLIELSQIVLSRPLNHVFAVFISHERLIFSTSLFRHSQVKTKKKCILLQPPSLHILLNFIFFLIKF